MKTSRGSGFPCSSHVPHVLWAITSLGQHVPTCLLAWIQVFWWHRINKDRLLTQLMSINTFLSERSIMTPIWQWDSLQHDGSGAYLSQLWYYGKMWDQLSGHQQPAFSFSDFCIHSVCFITHLPSALLKRQVCLSWFRSSQCLQRGHLHGLCWFNCIYSSHIGGQASCGQV